MHRIDAPDATSDHRFTEGNPTIPIPATTVTADWLNAVQEEIVAVLTAAKAAPNKADNAQLAAAITGLIAEGAAAKTVSIKAGTGLTGGGDLSADRTLAVRYGTTAGTACQGNDARLTNARTPTAHKATHKTGGTDALTPADIGAASSAVTITAGNGLTGGGQLTGNVTLAAKLLDSVASTDTTSAGTANAVKVAYDTAVNALNVASSAQTASGAKAPMPQGGAGVGQWTAIGSLTGSATLPNGGAWAYWGYSWTNISSDILAMWGIVAGGTVVVPGGNGRSSVSLFIWRIA